MSIVRPGALLTGLVVAGALSLAACGSSASDTSSAAAASSIAPASSATSSASSTVSLPAGLTAYGFPRVADSASFTPGQPLTLHAGDLTVTVPANALEAAATVQVLIGDNTYWQPLAPAGQKVDVAFAFRVVDSSGTEVTSFKAPIVAAYTNAAITATSQYLNTTRSTPPMVSVNPKPPVISGTTLTHGNIGDGVGWLMTSAG